MTTRRFKAQILRLAAIVALWFTATVANAQWSVIPFHDDSDNDVHARGRFL
jgi:hypothetical protein